jgi:ankyrin repeat protein
MIKPAKMGSSSSSRKIKTNAVTKIQDLALFLKVKEGSAEAVHYLEKSLHWKNLKISDVSLKQTDWTLLHLASWYGHSELCKELVLLGADINEKDAVIFI